jgi:hypothetical protein
MYRRKQIARVEDERIEEKLVGRVDMEPRERLENRECEIKEGWNKRGRLKRQRGKRPMKKDRDSMRKGEGK